MKIRILQIVADNHRTLRSAQSNRIAIVDVAVFYMLPLLCTLAVLCTGATIDSTIASILVTALSIFAALLFNLLLLVCDIAKRDPRYAISRNDPRTAIRAELIRQIFVHISFGILVALLAIGFLVASVWSKQWTTAAGITGAIGIGLIAMFVADLLLVMSRMHSLITSDLGRTSSERGTDDPSEDQD
jgi:sterol desaturase/sphingolipid hydroxylase (fatty acid hydroxylase superfamily)